MTPLPKKGLQLNEEQEKKLQENLEQGNGVYTNGIYTSKTQSKEDKYYPDPYDYCCKPKKTGW